MLWLYGHFLEELPNFVAETACWIYIDIVFHPNIDINSSLPRICHDFTFQLFGGCFSSVVAMPNTCCIFCSTPRLPSAFRVSSWLSQLGETAFGPSKMTPKNKRLRPFLSRQGLPLAGRQLSVTMCIPKKGTMGEVW